MSAIGILFDKDGTLLDFEATYAPACAAVMRELAGGDEARAEDMAAAVGFDLAAASFAADSVMIAASATEIAAAWEPHLPAEAGPGLAGQIDTLFERHARETVTLFDGVHETLSLLARQGLRVGLATNDAEFNGRAHIAAAGLEGLVEFFAGYDSGHGAKPGPGMVEAFARHCGCETGRIVMVGDSVHDMAAARAAGAIGVAVTTGPADRAELAPHADHTIDGLHELTGLPVLGITGAGG